jgi:hypothetical protein
VAYIHLPYYPTKPKYLRIHLHQISFSISCYPWQTLLLQVLIFFLNKVEKFHLFVFVSFILFGDLRVRSWCIVFGRIHLHQINFPISCYPWQTLLLQVLIFISNKVKKFHLFVFVSFILFGDLRVRS